MGAAGREIVVTTNTIGRRAFRFVRRSRCSA